MSALLMTITWQSVHVKIRFTHEIERSPPGYVAKFIASFLRLLHVEGHDVEKMCLVTVKVPGIFYLNFLSFSDYQI